MRLAPQPSGGTRAELCFGQPSAERLARRSESRVSHATRTASWTPSSARPSSSRTRRQRRSAMGRCRTTSSARCSTVPLLGARWTSRGGDVIGANVHQIRRIVATARPLGYLDLCYRKKGLPGPSPPTISTPQSVTDFNSPWITLLTFDSTERGPVGFVLPMRRTWRRDLVRSTCSSTRRAATGSPRPRRWTCTATD